jgi:hypothetical protein
MNRFVYLMYFLPYVVIVNSNSESIAETIIKSSKQF